MLSWCPMFELFKMMQHLAAVERANVVRLRRRKATHGPAQMHEMRLDRMRQRMHADLFRQPVALPRVAWAAGRNDVRPLVSSTARQRNQVITRQGFTMLQLGHVTTAVLAPITVAREQERVRHLPAEAPRHVDELRQANDRRTRHRQTLRSNKAISVSLDDLGFSVDDETKGPTKGDHRQRFIRRVQCQAADNHAHLRWPVHELPPRLWGGSGGTYPPIASYAGVTEATRYGPDRVTSNSTLNFTTGVEPVRKLLRD